MGEETATATEPTKDEKPQLSNFGEFCQKKGINPNLIMLKITLFVMYGGVMLTIIVVELAKILPPTEKEKHRHTDLNTLM